MPAPTLTAAQLEAQLWADERERVAAVVLGSRVPELPQRLAAADVSGWHCLRPGALSRREQAEAAYLVLLRRPSKFSDWLLFEAGAGLPDWGVLALSAAPVLALRSHMRMLTQARLPDGQALTLDWMDPPVLDALLPHFDAAALRAFFGPMRALVIPAPTRWRRAELQLGQLMWHEAVPAKAS